MNPPLGVDGSEFRNDPIDGRLAIGSVRYRAADDEIVLPSGQSLRRSHYTLLIANCCKSRANAGRDDRKMLAVHAPDAGRILSR